MTREVNEFAVILNEKIKAYKNNKQILDKQFIALINKLDEEN